MEEIQLIFMAPPPHDTLARMEISIILLSLILEVGSDFLSISLFSWRSMTSFVADKSHLKSSRAIDDFWSWLDAHKLSNEIKSEISVRPIETWISSQSSSSSNAAWNKFH